MEREVQSKMGRMKIRYQECNEYISILDSYLLMMMTKFDEGVITGSELEQHAKTINNWLKQYEKLR